MDLRIAPFHTEGREREGLSGKQVAEPGFKFVPCSKFYSLTYVAVELCTKKRDADYSHSPHTTSCYVQGTGEFAKMNLFGGKD